MNIEIQKYWGDTELYHVPELCSKIIHSMQLDGSVTLMTKEPRCSRTNGGFALLDSLCKYWKWDKSKITLITANRAESHDEYNIVKSKFRHGITFERTVFADYIPWNKEKCYGLFIGRASAARIRAIHNHNTFKFKHLGLASLHDDLFEYMDKQQLVQYFMESGQTYQEMISIKPFSDIDEIKKPPITPTSYDKIDWASVYSKIGIEIVCETSTVPDNYQITEKLDRCVKYRRPFLTVAPAGFNKWLNSLDTVFAEYKEIGVQVRTFEKYLGIEYDHLSGAARVDAIFAILENLIETGRIYSILDDCKEDIEHNYLMYTKMNSNHNLLKTDEDAALWEYWERYRGKPDE